MLYECSYHYDNIFFSVRLFSFSVVLEKSKSILIPKCFVWNLLSALEAVGSLCSWGSDISRWYPWYRSNFIHSAEHLEIPFNMEIHVLQFWEFSSIFNWLLLLFVFYTFFFCNFLLFRHWVSWASPQIFFLFFFFLFCLFQLFFS